MPIDELLLQLREITAPVEPGWWPLAPGWWLLIGISALSSLAWLILRKRQRSHRRFRLADQALRRIQDHHARVRDDRNLVLELSRWLRQVSLIAFPERRIASITGPAWLAFLDETTAGAQFSQGAGRVFAGKLYSRRPEVEVTEILKLCDAWMAAVRPRLENPGSV